MMTTFNTSCKMNTRSPRQSFRLPTLALPAVVLAALAVFAASAPEHAGAVRMMMQTIPDSVPASASGTDTAAHTPKAQRPAATAKSAMQMSPTGAPAAEKMEIPNVPALTTSDPTLALEANIRRRAGRVDDFVGLTDERLRAYYSQKADGDAPAVFPAPPTTLRPWLGPALCEYVRKPRHQWVVVTKALQDGVALAGSKRYEAVLALQRKIGVDISKRVFKVLNLVEQVLLKHAVTLEDRVYWWKVVGDCWRYRAEIAVKGSALEQCIFEAQRGYEHAAELVTGGPGTAPSHFGRGLLACNDVALGLWVNYAIFQEDILGNWRLARRTTQAALDALTPYVRYGKEEFGVEAGHIRHQMLRNMQRWLAMDKALVRDGDGSKDSNSARTSDSTSGDDTPSTDGDEDTESGLNAPTPPPMPLASAKMPTGNARRCCEVTGAAPGATNSQA